jgi:sarcosine oxidase subunit beta
VKSGRRIIICGAGISGISAAYHLAKAGARSVVIIDQLPPLSLTSNHSTECYRNWWPDPVLQILMDRSIDIMDELSRESQNVIRLNRRGYLYVTADRDRLDEMIRKAEYVAGLGAGPLRVHTQTDSAYDRWLESDSMSSCTGADLLLDRNLIHTQFPGLSASVVGALHARRAGWLSAQQLGMYLLERAESLGITRRKGRIEAIDIEHGHFRGIVLETGERIEADALVNAAGPEFRHFGALCGLDLPVVAELHMKLAFQDTRRCVDRGSPLLIWDDPVRLPWTEEEREILDADMDTAPLASVLPGGAHMRPEGPEESHTLLMLWDYQSRVQEPVFPVPLDDHYAEVVLRGLAVMVPALSGYVGRSRRPELDGGYYVKTPENRPLVGPTSIKGIYLLGAVSGYGIMAACATGELLAAHVLDRALPDYADALRLSRYDEAGYLESLADVEAKGEL